MARHTYLCPMRWSDMDAYGHVNNVVFVRYLEEARIDLLLNAAGPGGPGRARDACGRHRRGATRGRLPQAPHRASPVPIVSWVEEIKNASFTVGYEIADGEDVYITARTVLVLVDLDSGRPRRIGAEDRAWLDRFLDDA